MTEQQIIKREKIEATKIALKLFQAFYGRAYKKDILLLETGFNGKGCDYVLFRNTFTGAEFCITGNPATGDYKIEELDDDE